MSLSYLEAAKQNITDSLSLELVEDIKQCEAELHDQMKSDVEVIEKSGLHLIESGGKRLRPTLVSLGTRAIGLPFERQRIWKIGTAVEMIHIATLIHDDVIDNANLRRGRPTVSSIWGNTSAILSGDALLAKAMRILAEDGDIEIIRILSNAVVDLAEGEVEEVSVRGDFEISQTVHYKILEKKTASLLASCCKVGAMIAQASIEEQDALERYGYAMGMAFQIADDILDFTGEHETTGKPRATDFREGCATLPLILLREKLNHEELEYLRSRFGNGVKEDDLSRISDLMKQRGAINRAINEAKSFAENAKESLKELPSSDARDFLNGIADYVISRDK